MSSAARRREGRAAGRDEQREIALRRLGVERDKRARRRRRALVAQRLQRAKGPRRSVRGPKNANFRRQEGLAGLDAAARVEFTPKLVYDTAADASNCLSFWRSKEIMRVLGIETTCDETAAAVVRLRHDGCGEILSDEVMSQISQHSSFGGVVPEIAARAHVELIDGLVTRALRRAGMTAMEIDGVAAAAGPGLIGGVLVGLMTGKGIALATGKPFIAVNHLEAHALTPRLTERLTFPYLLLLASGGHTQWLAVRGVGDYVRLGATLDDAIGEAFDKTARLLGLPYPGGPAIEIAARSGDGERFDFPRPMMGRPNADFSLSGLKTAVRHAVAALNGSRPLRDNDVADVAASFQAAVVDVIEDRLRVAMRMFRACAGRPACRRDRGRRRRQWRDSRHAGAILRPKRPAAGGAAAQTLHRQRRDDRLGGRRAAANQSDGHARRARAPAVAARPERRAVTQRQGLGEDSADCR